MYLTFRVDKGCSHAWEVNYKTTFDAPKYSTNVQIEVKNYITSAYLDEVFVWICILDIKLIEILRNICYQEKCNVDKI